MADQDEDAGAGASEENQNQSAGQSAGLTEGAQAGADTTTEGADSAEAPAAIQAEPEYTGLKKLVRDTLAAQPFRGETIHREDFLAVMDAIADAQEARASDYQRTSPGH